MKEKHSQKPRILHLVHDDKFIDAANVTFEEVFPGSNTFVCIGKKTSFRYIKDTPITFISRHELFHPKFREELKDFEVIVFHSFCDTYNFSLALLAPKQCKLIWIGWGFDYYDLITSRDLLLKAYTKKVKDKIIVSSIQGSVVKSALKKLILRALRFLALKRMCIFSPVIKEDFESVKKKNPWLKATYVSWNYSFASSLISQIPFVSCPGENILVGNSASFENNHLDVFYLLSKIDIGERKIICPLSYGNESYRDYLIREGEKLFGKSFIPVLDFLPLKEYSNLLSSCGYMIMNHLRQQAAGNIALAFLLGTKVFLDPNNPLFGHYQRAGFGVFPINDLNQGLFGRLPEAVRRHNRQLMLERLDRRTVNKQTENLIKQALGL